jgi:tetratricopeptide (TPR) repeat protein
VQRGLLYALALVATLRIARSREGARRVEAAIVASVLLLAVVSLVHGLGELPEVFGIYSPHQGALGRHSGPVFNPNHLGGFLTIGFSIVFAWALSPEPPLPRVLSFALAAGLLATQVWVASRGATSALVVAGVLVAVGSWYARHRHGSLGAVGAAMALAVAIGSALIVLGSSDGAWNELLDPGLGKIDDIKATLRLVPRAPFTGVGRGAFEGAYPAVQERAVNLAWEAPESLVPHWLCEWGVPVTVIALGTIAYALRLRYVYERAVPPVGPWVAVMAVALQNMGDFGSEVPSLGLLCTACAGVVVAGNRGRTLTRAQRHGWQGAVWVTGIALAALSYDLGAKGDHEIGLDRRLTRAAILDPGKTPAEADDAYAAAALRHPGEPYFAYVRAYRAAYERTPDLFGWVAHTLERDPHHGGAALMLARTLVDRNPAQARDAYRRAATDDPALVDQAIREGLRLVRTYDQALELVPRGEETARRSGLGVLVRALAPRMPATVLTFEDSLARIDAGDPALLERRAARALAALRLRMPWCAGEGLAKCLEDARIAARDLQSRSPERCHGHAVEAEALLLAGFADEGVALLRAAFDRVADRADCNLRLVEFAGKAGLRQVLTEALDELTAGACLDPSGCVGRLMAIASLELQFGNPGRALSAYERAHETEPQNLGITEGLANLSVRLGRHRQAADAYAALAAAKPDREDYREAHKRAQRALTEQLAREPSAIP